jgi:hypothetical protein
MKPNYQFEKRKRDLDKQAKKKEKQQRKLEKANTTPTENSSEAPTSENPPAE